MNPVAETRRHSHIVAEKKRHLAEKFQPQAIKRRRLEYYFLEFLFLPQIKGVKTCKIYYSVTLFTTHWDILLFYEFYSVGTTFFYETLLVTY